MRISELPREHFSGFELVYSFDSRAFFDLRTRLTENVFSAELLRTPCPPIHRDITTALFAPQWEEPHAYGLWDGQNLLGLMEVTPEKKKSTLRITSFFVQDGFRRRGYGSLLMTKAREIAKAAGKHALVFETLSCNTAAISFALSQGFTFLGFQATSFSDHAINRQEMQMYFGLLL